MSETIALIDFGAGNLHSVHNALMAAGAGDVAVTADPHLVARADRIILPGVGAFGACRDALVGIEGMVAAMERRVRDEGVPFLGICVGMQMLADKGIEFGAHDGLGWIGGTVEAIDPADETIKIPHMGWNDVTPTEGHDLLEPGEAYYLHGYHFAVADKADILATTDHGGSLVSAVGRDNIVGVQFHPEKSQAYGLAFLNRFLEWKP
ncbi:MAG: imidazole glycerol phosphate synthase subunit HisH [Sphingomonadales bacterium]|nr:imidazole glycerol phosphate synthase subunit HisH [Sphingomonadales bacterium]NCO49686.1 imidazole glycerol phosphate synthase subunit HisH [Sphingomonadales bacterium]NCO98604.1 imidazole glycerol phosphate synthase subunit HisH [Sphingomonadales bacterium]NCP26101.1 imidazole glycerol phosphate synthase subunit HisH [Sphingomonadales bacterium]NCP44390.1 imidazole glycerol phosphate synthase subunit HisH [Sphingomonadales bacterium]